MPSSTFPLGIQDSLILPKGAVFDEVTEALKKALLADRHTQIEWVAPLLGNPSAAIPTFHPTKGFVGYQWPFYLRHTRYINEKGDPFNLFLNDVPPFEGGYITHRIQKLLHTIRDFYDAKKE